ncbi:phosphate signaling complex protein PhoU [Methylococcus sp. EFPC2]|uniref:phosphate signaling complex protein PhoU n=1 Tax=Methylococcus sp. EFPC2 TaxID=2812648 RepID=UPI0019677844|nr:phosphate signaling complex protein PhoU [Methylococcus sp. EFPC2]QSA97189.1 phosphate signaling complex protein PhoU [Methylococcus sp. EFPC2]
MPDISIPPTRHHHISKQFDQELADIRSRVLTMGGVVEEQVALALKSMRDNDMALAEQVIRDDVRVNLEEVTLDAVCTEILARRQPAASDLRLVIAVVKTINDLERIGDDAKFIARCALALAGQFPRKGQLEALHAFGQQLCETLKLTLDAYVRLDVEAALRIKEQDRLLDEVYQSIVRQQIASMSEDGRGIPAGLNLLWAARALERIGDRCCNICEYVIYYVKGKDIRHISLEQALRDIGGA